MSLRGSARRIVVVGLALSAGAFALRAPVAAASTPAVAATPVAAAAGAAKLAPGTGTADLNVTGTLCGAASFLSKLGSLACGALTHAGSLLKGGKQLVHGDVGGAISTVLGGGGATAAATASTALGLAAIGIWVVGGAKGVLHATAAALGATTSPQLHSTWFSSTYWRMAAIAAVLTLPFLFAAAIQALIRSDLALLVRATFGYLPVAMLAIAIAAPLTTLVLSACDQLCSLISSAAANESATFLNRAALGTAALSAIDVSPFLAFLVGLFVIAAAFALWIELLMREAAVYVVVLMLPLAFAAFVWPARRIWAIRAVELLVALILSKFAVVAVLSLGGAAVSAAGGSVTALMAGAVLILLAAFSPWALVRLIPLAELAAGAAGSLRGEFRAGGVAAEAAAGLAATGDDWVGRVTGSMRHDAGAMDLERPPVAQARAAAGAEAGSAEPMPDEVAVERGAVSSEGAVAAGAVSGNGAVAAGTAISDPVAREDGGGSSRAENWHAEPAFELGGENFGSTPVWPNEEAP